MAARDDSVIRGSLITCLILLVLSLALNFILWSWGSGQADERATIASRLNDVSNGLRTAEEKIITMQKMLGAEQMTQDEFDSFANSSSGDPEFDALATQFHNDMQVFGQDVGIQDRHYGALVDYFMNAIRDRNEQYGVARDDAPTASAMTVAWPATTPTRYGHKPPPMSPPPVRHNRKRKPNAKTWRNNSKTSELNSPPIETTC